MQNFFFQTPVASVLFALTLAASLYTFSNPQQFGRWMLHPYSISRGRQRYTLITSGFIHKDWGHLFFNMFTFYFFGFGLEKLLVSLSTWGHVQFALIYMLGMVLSDLTTVYAHRNHPQYYSLGASGAICAVLFSYILFMPKSMLGVFLIIPMPAWLFGLLFLFYCAWAAKQARDGINHEAHFYGAIVGVILTILFYPNVISYFIQQFS
jgi:membrane associated rhomboid family serine protease